MQGQEQRTHGRDAMRMKERVQQGAVKHLAFSAQT